ncbi:GlxA family transcriptional regulator [Pararhodobacter sp.]|uniref:GlxA family transcriptional regulator n=1 Tax=Pararhodobacter sp. TaxID=2127056 RepID=UPI002AFFE739|nr:GlxA family transcriptional regulator [Pararhodobacter sp.]
MQTIGILPIEGFSLLSLASVVDPFRSANLLSRKKLYDIVTIGRDLTPVASSGPAMARISHLMTNDLELGSLFVIAGGRPENFSDQKTLHWIEQMFRKGVCICGVSGGPVILAKAGIVTGHRMTVHWEHAPALLEAYPDLMLERTLFTRDRRLITYGGGAAALDMTLALIGQDHGPEFVRKVGDWCLHTDIREATRAQRRAAPRNVGPANAAIVQVVQAMETHIAVPLSLPDLAQIAGLSERQLNRVFVRATDETVMGYYRNLRLDCAANLLRSSALSVTQIALATGFASSSHFTAAYRARYGVLPSASRA